MEDAERMAQEAIALQHMQRDMGVVKAMVKENIGSEEDRIKAIVDRCVEAGYERGRDYPKDSTGRWVAVGNGPDYRVDT